MSDDQNPPVAGTESIPMTFGSVALVVPAGDMVWCLVMIERPTGVAGETEQVPKRWVVFPRGGFMVSLLAAVEQFLPGFGGVPPEGMPRPAAVH